MRARAAALAVGLALLALTGCAGGSVAESSPTGAVSLPPHGAVTPSASPTGTPVDVPAAKWDAIAQDLADRGVTGTPTLVSSEAVTWNNGALGCPKPGGTYTQALIDGMRVVVSVEGKTYDYRFGADDAAKLCVQGVHG